MKLTVLLLATLLAMSSAGFAQADTPAHGHPVREIIDSLKAGRQRWAGARVIEYYLQSHADCFCVYRPDQLDKQLPLLTIRQGSVMSRGKGKPGTPPSPEFTITDLFHEVEEDASSDGRIIDRLDLDPVYGFPTRYEAT